MTLLEYLIITSVDEAVTVYSEKGKDLDIVNRQYFGLCFCKNGEIVYTKNGQKTVSHPGCAVILPLGGSYHLERTKTGEFPLINFSCQGLEPNRFYSFPVRNVENYLHDYEILREQLLLGHSRLRALELLYGIFDRLERETVERNDVFAPILSYVEAHYADSQLSNSLLAAKGGISEVYMRQLFRERLGTSPRQYILELRMQKAKQMLCEGHSTIGTVAAACGFAAIYHFSRAFKSFTGESPSDYRRAHRRVLL
ncbi:MAG: helix-turn-helix transcriptional regulator [Clostridia bacterium]|nr:helix-turn-helix transcriptional regulator [Clostridia bacterium]